MVMDNSFYYDDKGNLQGLKHPNPDYLYPNLFYHGVTRVREHLALIIVDAPELFSTILTIVRVKKRMLQKMKYHLNVLTK